MFRFDKESNQWKERGTGEVKFLQHKETKKIRVLMRREKTLKICANHYLIPALKLTPNVGSDRSWVWTATDFSEGDVPTVETLAIRFGTTERASCNSSLQSLVLLVPDAKEFKEKFEQYQAQNPAASPAKTEAKTDDKPADKPAEAAPAAEEKK